MKTTESGPIKKKVDILWVGVIEKYLVDGDITNLEGLIRNGGVPAEFGDQIADIFTKPVREDIFFRLRNLLLQW